MKHKTNIYAFNFIIVLHLDDLDALKYIQSTLQLGKIIINQSRKEVRFIISTQREIAVIIAIFSKNNLNTTKHLNFLTFERAFQLYMDNSSLEARKQINPIIEGIKSEMNSKRTYFYLPGTHYNITPH